MSGQKLYSLSLEDAGSKVPARIKLLIDSALNEQEAYAADELVELAEELLNQLAAIGMASYIKSGIHKDVNNDFLLQLFNSSGHEYNAGPLYRWAANMIRENSEIQDAALYPFFWETKNGKETLNEAVHHLSELRNQVMHGFFVLPPEKNREEAEKIGKLLLEMVQHGIFKSDFNFHFCDQNGFTGNWNIQTPEQWNDYSGESAFGKLCERIITEQNESFWQNENAAFSEGDDSLIPSELKEFIANKTQGAFACWVHPADSKANTIYASMGHWLKNEKDVLFVGYNLHENGLSFTGDFILRRLYAILYNPETKIGKDKKLTEQVAILRKSHPQKKVVVLINQVQLALFSPQHVTSLTNFLYDNNILLVAIGNHYEHFNPLFNQQFKKEHSSSIPDLAQQKILLQNYLRFKGPFHDRKEDEKDIVMLKEIFEKLCLQLQTGEEIYARRFADEHDYSIEYVHEVFALLHPWIKTERKHFEEDTVDELYGFPTIMTEVTPIYLALGRRDVKLEYQHKVISFK
jgi:hypothetical protein